MNLIASGIVRGMMGASSQSDLAGTYRKTKGRGSAAESGRTSESAAESLYASAGESEDAREALKGTQSESKAQEKNPWQQSFKGWRYPASGGRGTDTVSISDAGRSGGDAALSAGTAAQSSQEGSKAQAAGSRLSIKI